MIELLYNYRIYLIKIWWIKVLFSSIYTSPKYNLGVGALPKYIQNTYLHACNINK